MTEQEAKTKWCPFVRYGETSCNRGAPPADEGYMRCIGSACMAWRWTAFAEGEEHAGNVHGYCGLAGK